MDTSEQYIKMRFAALPFMGRGIKPTYPVHNTDDSGNTFVDIKGNFYLSIEEDWVQLERQDQLQEMVDYDPLELIEKLYRFTTDTGWDDWKSWFKYIKSFTSMEQLWLAFVMKENHGKIWTSSRWELS